MAEIRLENLSKRYGETEVLREITLNVSHGEFFTLVGPSGCGKSTLLHLMAGLEELSSGEIYFDGRPISHLAPKERDIAVVFQSYALYPHMTIYDNIAFPLRMKKRPLAEIDRQVRKVADHLDLADMLSRKPGTLSGGQRQRVALGRAIVRQPQLFLLDEPLSNLDARLRVEMRSELKSLHRRLKITMIYVTHDQAEAMTLSDRVAVLQDGIIQQCGTPQEVYHRPANRFVAGFIGSPSMNFMEGRLSTDRTASVTLGENVPYRISEEVHARLRTAGVTGRVIIGIRPEHIRILPKVNRSGGEARVSMVEPMGSEVWVDLEWANQKIKVKASADYEGKAGDEVSLEIDDSRAHYFEIESGRRIP